MIRPEGLLRRGLKWTAFVLAVSALTAAAATDDAQARSRRHHRHRAAVESYSPPYAHIVVDANTGAVMSSSNPDTLRHPASLTKIMTLYLLFEQLEAGKLKMTSELPVSEHASEQAPSKLGLKPGETIEVNDAIRAIVTKSANDVAVIIAEAVGGDEDRFAAAMTRKARELGMKNTLYRNASGLPDDEQVTTARDQALLGRAIQQRFPKYYKFFSTPSFVHNGRVIRNHNKLLGNVDGVDGIKTGYTRASGFNLVTSVRRGARHLVAAVFGGRTARWRDGRMRELIADNIGKASTKATAAALVANVSDEEIQRATPTKRAEPSPVPLPLAAQEPPSVPQPAPVASAAPPAPVDAAELIKPRPIKTVSVRLTNAQGAGAMGQPQKLGPPRHTKIVSIATVRTETAVRPDSPSVALASAGPEDKPPAPAAEKSKGGWQIQIGAFDDAAEARERIAVAQKKAADALKGGNSYTEPVAKSGKTLYRARIAGFDKDQAENACKQLKRGEIPCMVLKN